MGKKNREIRKTLKDLGNLKYIEVRNVPFRALPDYGDAVSAQVLSEIELGIVRVLILRRFKIRGQEVEFIRRGFALSQREFASRLGLSHVSVLKWERASTRPLDVVNEVAVKALAAGLLRMNLPASIEALSGQAEIPERWILDYRELRDSVSAGAA